MLHPCSISPGTQEAHEDEAEGVLHSFVLELELPLLAGPTLTGLQHTASATALLALGSPPVSVPDVPNHFHKSLLSQQSVVCTSI